MATFSNADLDQAIAALVVAATEMLGADQAIAARQASPEGASVSWILAFQFDNEVDHGEIQAEIAVRLSIFSEEWPIAVRHWRTHWIASDNSELVTLFLVTRVVGK